MDTHVEGQNSDLDLPGTSPFVRARPATAHQLRADAAEDIRLYTASVLDSLAVDLAALK